jgi:hypothetical protein
MGTYQLRGQEIKITDLILAFSRFIPTLSRILFSTCNALYYSRSREQGTKCGLHLHIFCTVHWAKPEHVHSSRNACNTHPQFECTLSIRLVLKIVF